MKNSRKLFCLLSLFVLMVFVLTGCGESTPKQSQRDASSSESTPKQNQRAASIEDISIKTEPKIAYVLGEAFDSTNGVLSLTYDDATVKEKAFTEEGVHITEPDMTSVGTKTVTVEYDGFIATYMIQIDTSKSVLTFNLNYESAPTAQTQAVEIGAFAQCPQDPSRDGYVFRGWFTDAQGVTAFDFTADPMTEDKTVYAAWTSVSSVTFNYNYPDAPDAQSVQVETGAVLPDVLIPSASRTGYVLNAWHTQAEADSPFDFSQPITEDVTLYAHWNEIQAGAEQFMVTINYNGAGGLPKKEVSVVGGSKVKAPQAPTADGRAFTGWFADQEAKTTFNFDAPITKNVTVYAGWDVENYVVTFKYVLGGKEKVLRVREIDPGQKVSAGTVPVVAGYKFVNEWYTDKEYSNKFDFKTPVEQDYTLYIRPLKENRFEAEYTFIDDGKTGVGSSDNFSGLKLIFKDKGTASASNGYWVSGLYYNTAFVEFVIFAEENVSNAILQANLSAEWADMYLAPKNETVGDQNYYKFEFSCAPALTEKATGRVQKDKKGYTLYDTAAQKSFNYAPIAITGAISFSESMVDKRPFSEYLITDEFTLSKGWNVIRLTVANNHAPYDGTMEATAPMIDCINIFTDAKLSWEPVVENVADPDKLNN